MGNRKQRKMGVLLLIKPIKWIYILYQGVLIIATLVNVFYWFIVRKTFFFTSIILLFLPIDRFSTSHNILHLVFFFLFFILTVFSYIKMIPELLYSQKVRLPYTLANMFWFFVTTYVAVIISPYTKLYSIFDSDLYGLKLFIVPNATFIILFILVVALWGVRREERFQLRATGNEQIIRTAKGPLVFVSGCTLLCFVMWYLGSPFSKVQYILYAFCLFVLIISFIATITETKRLNKKEPSSDEQNKKLIVLHIAALLGLAVSFGCMKLLDNFVIK